MASRRTWVWIVVGVLGAGILVLVAAAGASVYFVTHHIRAERTTDAEAIRSFDAVRASFHNARPLYDLDSANQPQIARPLAAMPASSWRATEVHLLAWNPDETRLVRIALPLWILHVGHRRMSVTSDDHSGFDLQQMNLDPDELSRIGPALLLDFRTREGVRVLVWTE